MMRSDSYSVAVHAAIVEDPSVMRGVPVFRGTRVPIANVLASLKAGFNLEQLKEAYPCLTKELVEAALAYCPRGPFEEASGRNSRVRCVLVSRERVPPPAT